MCLSCPVCPVFNSVSSMTAAVVAVAAVSAASTVSTYTFPATTTTTIMPVCHGAFSRHPSQCSTTPPCSPLGYLPSSFRCRRIGP